MKRVQGRIGALILLAAVVAVGCADKRTPENGQGTPTAQASQAAPPSSETLVIPTGTIVVASLNARLATDVNHTGDSFNATTTEPIVVGGRTVVPAGAQIHGVLGYVEASGRISGRARMTLEFAQIEDGQGVTHSISARPITLQAASKTKGDVEKIAAGGVLGAIIGGIAGGGKGAAIGAGVGAGTGTVVMLATKGDDIELAAGHRVNVRLMSPTNIVLVAQR